MKNRDKRYRVSKSLLLAAVLLLIMVGLVAAFDITGVGSEWANAGGECLDYDPPGSSPDDSNVWYGRQPGTTGCNSTSNDEQSGFGFNGNSGLTGLSPGDVFLIGEFKHYNRPIQNAGSDLGPLDLNLTLTLDPDGAGPEPSGEYDFTFELDLDETTNVQSGDVNDCTSEFGYITFPPATVCDDIVEIDPIPTGTTVIVIDNVTYTLNIVGFEPLTEGFDSCFDLTDPPGTIQSKYQTEEQAINVACLYGFVTEFTAVTLSYFGALPSGDMVDIRWQTATETGTAGFNVYAETESGRVQLNESMIASQVVDSLEPTDYAFSAKTEATIFYLEEVQVDGKRNRFGPYELGVEYGSYIPIVSMEPGIYLPFVGR